MDYDHPTVLVVDDDPAMRDALRFMFTQTGLRVETYASAEEFLAALNAETCGCIILDLRMPGLDGVKLHERLRICGSQLPVIFLTGHGDMHVAVEEMKVGAFDFISKPVNRDVLLQRVGEAIALGIARLREGEDARDINRRFALLSPREVEVLEQVAHGQASKQIAISLGLAELTVANHRAHILRKMGAANSADLVRKLALIGRVPPPEQSPNGIT